MRLIKRYLARLFLSALTYIQALFRILDATLICLLRIQANKSTLVSAVTWILPEMAVWDVLTIVFETAGYAVMVL